MPREGGTDRDARGFLVCSEARTLRERASRDIRHARMELQHARGWFERARATRETGDVAFAQEHEAHALAALVWALYYRASGRTYRMAARGGPFLGVNVDPWASSGYSPRTAA